jgi:hypothetical protein
MQMADHNWSTALQAPTLSKTVSFSSHHLCILRSLRVSVSVVVPHDAQALAVSRSFPASPITLVFGSVASRSRIPLRMTAQSSATSTRIMFCPI